MPVRRCCMMSTGLFFHHISLVALEDAKVADLSRGPTLALLSAAAQDRASVFALFGGQANEVYFNELQSLYDIYTPYLTPLTPPSLTRFLNLLNPHGRLHHSTHMDRMCHPGLQTLSLVETFNPISCLSSRRLPSYRLNTARSIPRRLSRVRHHTWAAS
jgi:hypothetical protein